MLCNPALGIAKPLCVIRRKLKKGQKYKLISFNGTTKPNKVCKPNENYWKLLNQYGTLMNFSDDLNFGNDNRVLIQFEQDVIKQGLECHNPVANALWILKTDLEQITEN